MLRGDFHTHTIFSFDSMVDPQEYVRRCVAAGITCVAVTEHNNIDGALYLREIAPFKVIVAEEIRTREGEIIGFFLEEEVPPGLSPEETVERIKSQGGLVGAPHAFDPLRSGLGDAALRRIAKDVDIIEAFNARIHVSRHNERAAAFAREFELAVTAGTDAHSPWELGRAYIEMPDFETPQQFLSSLREGRLVGRTASRVVHAFSTAEKVRRKLGLRRKLPRTSARAVNAR